MPVAQMVCHQSVRKAIVQRPAQFCRFHLCVFRQSRPSCRAKCNGLEPGAPGSYKFDYIGCITVRTGRPRSLLQAESELYSETKKPRAVPSCNFRMAKLRSQRGLLQCSAELENSPDRGRDTVELPRNRSRSDWHRSDSDIRRPGLRFLLCRRTEQGLIPDP